jgi:hypothetical protein
MDPMEAYTCYVRLHGSQTPHLRFVQSEDRSRLLSIVNALTREWPEYERIDVRDSADRVVAVFTQPARSPLTGRY